VLDAIRDGPYEAQFRETLRTKHGVYDADARLLREEITGDEPVGFVDLPAGTTVHPTRESLGYAVALLDAGERADRALAVLDRVLSLQDDRPDSAYRGCWPYYAELSLEEMERVDENWAAFLGKRLVELLADHADTLPDELRERSRGALARAARFLRERDVTPGYTNIALMSAFVVLAAGERLDDDELHDYGRRALRELVGYTRYHDGFTEYNSPTYTRVSLRELGRMRRYLGADVDLALARELEGYAWRTLAAHYHPPTRGLAGPHLRAYASAETGGFDAYVHLGTGGARGPDAAAVSTGLALPKLRLACPERYWRRFESDPDARFVRDRFYRGDGEYGTSIPVALEARTHLTERYALGTFTKAHCWYQSRPLIARWGARSPYYLRARWLRDGRDFASGVLAASQFENLVAGAATLVTDNGDVHPAIYGEDDEPMAPRETLSADRLIVRFEVGGDGSIEAAEPSSGTVRVTAGGVDLVLTVDESTLGGHSPTTRLRRVGDDDTDGRLHVDVVLHEGDTATFDLPATEVAVGFGLRIGAADAVAVPPVDATTREGRTVVTAAGAENPGRVAVPRRPVGLLEFLRSATVA
jgi:hypothetical protein